MRLLKGALALVLMLICVMFLLWFASQWWEKAFATADDIEVSPGGCYRLVRYEPFWVIPDSFHPARFPDEKWNPLTDWSAPWMPNKFPRFFRLFDNRTGAELGETPVYDLNGLETGDVIWPSTQSGWMFAGYIKLADHLPACVP